jgi:transposase
MMYVGIDLHRRRSHVVALDDVGRERLSRRIGNDPATFLGLLGELEGELEVALEAAYGWEWLADLLEGAGIRLHLAHPLGTKAIAAARVKTDAVDAATLAHLLRADLLPEAYVAPRELRDLRELLRQRVALTQLRTALKNRVHALLARHGVRVHRSDLFGKGGRAFLAGLPLREPQRRRLESLLSLIDAFERELAAAAAEIDELASADPRVDVLTQLPGIGRYTALLVIAEVGDVSRFPGPRQLCSYAGLVPLVRSSDAKTRLGHISRQGSPQLRWALVEAAQHAARANWPLRTSFEQIAHRRGRRVAKIALARKLLTLCYYGLRDGEIRCLAPRRR